MRGGEGGRGGQETTHEGGVEEGGGERMRDRWRSGEGSRKRGKGGRGRGGSREREEAQGGGGRGGVRLRVCENGACDLLKSLTFWMGCVAGPL